MAPPDAWTELEQLRLFLRKRIEDEIRKTGDAKSFASRVGMSESQLSIIRRNAPLTSAMTGRILSAIGMSLSEALAEAKKMPAPASRNEPPPPESENLRTAIAALAREGATIRKPVRAIALEELRAEGDRPVDSWMQLLRGLRVADERGRLQRRVHDTSAAVEQTRPRVHLRQKPESDR